MKALIWIVTILVVGTLNGILGALTGFMLGYGLAPFLVVLISLHFCRKWDIYKLKKRTVFTFRAYFELAGRDSYNSPSSRMLETSVTVELTKEESRQLVFSGLQMPIYSRGFSQCSNLSGIYCKIKKIAVEKITQKVRDDIESGFIKVLDDEKALWEVDNNVYYCTVEFPEELKKCIPKKYRNER